MMKRILIFALAIVIIASCKQESTTAWPEDLAGKEALLSEKRKEVKAIQNDIDQLKAEIAKLNPNQEKDPTLVTVETTEKGDLRKYAIVQGSVQSDDVVYVSSETGGRIIQINAQEGDYVRKGQLIAKVDMQSLNNQIAEVQTQLDLAETVFDRQKKLWDQNIGSEIQFLQAKNNVERLEKTITTLNTQLSKANIYAPIGGAVDKELVKRGEVVGPGSPILQILNTARVKVVADVPESYLGSVKKGDQVEINFPAIDKTVNKRVSMLGRTIDPSNRTFKVEVNTNNPGGILKPNLLAELKFENFRAKDAITIPLNIVLEDVSGNKYVFVSKEKDGKLRAVRANVEIGESYEGRVMITNGLNAGDKVIIQGARNVTNGDPVIITKS